MPKAEVGSTKHLNNKLKSKGLQRLRWYCQVCEKQCRDENGFKMHTQAESHVRKLLLVGEDSKKFINDYSNQYQRDFLLLLRTSHGEKKVQLNQFYQQYIANKEHVHLNSTKWPSLTEFAKFVGREGICRVEEGEKGIEISWVDNSPEALRRQDALRKRERMDRGDEEREQKAVREQIARAIVEAAERDGEDDEGKEKELRREEGGEKIKLNFGAKSTIPISKLDSPPISTEPPSLATAEAGEPSSKPVELAESSVPEPSITAPAPAPAKVTMKMGISNKPKNVFAAAKKNALGGKKAVAIEQPKKMSEAERIMKEEMAKGKRAPPGFGGPPQKKQRF